MMLSLTAAEMTARARLILGYDHTRDDGDSTQATGTNTDVFLGRLLRQWYLQLLDTAPSEQLAHEAVSNIKFIADSAPAGATVLSAPRECRRMISVRLPGWGKASRVLPRSRFEDTERKQQNPYTAATAQNPVAVEGSDRNVVVCWPASADTGLTGATAAIDHGEEMYVMEESALLSLPSFLKKHFL